MKRYVSKLKDNLNLNLKRFEFKCNNLASKSPFTNVWGVARSLLAIGLLLTLVFNNNEVLFPETSFNVYRADAFLNKINIFYLFGFKYLWASNMLSVIILILVVSGIYPRITGLLHWWVSFSFFNFALIIDGGDQIAAVLTFYLIPISLLDDRSNHWTKSNSNNKYRNFLGWMVFLMIEIQIAILYLQAGIEKPYKVEEWADGTAVYYWLNHNIFGAPEWILTWLNLFLKNSLFVFSITWGVIIFELTLFGAFFMKKSIKARLLPLAILFHLMILIFHGLFSFFFSISAGLILYLCCKDKTIFIGNLTRDGLFRKIKIKHSLVK